MPLHASLSVDRPGPTNPTARTLIRVPLEALHPTQVAVGMRAVAAKREKVARRAKSRKTIANFLERRPIPAVRGPGKVYYIIDHHHLGLALWQNDIQTACVDVIEDLSSLTPYRFWRAMIGTGRAYPFDERGQSVAPRHIPSALAALRNDPYRDLAWSVREAGGYDKTDAPFSEFQWAQFFRGHLGLTRLRSNYDAAVARAVVLARSPASAHLPGYRPGTDEWRSRGCSGRSRNIGQ